MRQITVYYFPIHVHCGECGQAVQQVEPIPYDVVQRWAILACRNSSYMRADPTYDARNNCPNYGVRVKVHAQEMHLEVIE